MTKFFGSHGWLFWYSSRLKFDSLCEKGKNEAFVVFVEVVGVYAIFHKTHGISVIFQMRKTLNTFFRTEILRFSLIKANGAWWRKKKLRKNSIILPILNYI